MTQNTFEVTRSGATVKLDLAQLGPDMQQALLAHGIAAKVGDAAASASAIAGESHFGKPKKECNLADWKAWQGSDRGVKAIAEIAQSAMDGVLEALYANNWSQASKGGPRRASLPNDMAMAVRSAKQDLLVLFRKLTGQSKIADLATHEKVAPYFQTDTDKTVWEDAKVVEWIKAQAEAGKRDYVAEAKAVLSVDLEEFDF